MPKNDAPNDDYEQVMVLKLGPFDTRRIKKPSLLFSAPLEFLIPAGRIALSWGGIEQQMDSFITRALITSQRVEQRWHLRNFQKRKKLFRELLQETLTDAPTIIDYANSAMNDAAELYWKRNVIVHGRIIFKMSQATQQTTLLATGRHKGKTITLEALPDDLEQIFYDIAHAEGRLAQLLKNDSAIPSASSHEISVLRAFLASSRPPTA